MIARNSPRLPVYSGGPVIGGRPVPIASGDLPDDFTERLIQLKKAAASPGANSQRLLAWNSSRCSDGRRERSRAEGPTIASWDLPRGFPEGWASSWERKFLASIGKE